MLIYNGGEILQKNKISGKLYFRNFLISLVISMITFIILQIQNGVFKMNYWDILTSFISGLISSLFLSIFIYYKYLKKIPQETRAEIEKLLNMRLNYETTNHNAIQQNLNPSNKHLSSQHDKIIEQADKNKSIILADTGSIKSFLTEEKIKNDYREKLLTAEQRNIKAQISSIHALEQEMERMQEENYELRTALDDKYNEIHKLREINFDLRQKLNSQGQNVDIEF